MAPLDYAGGTRLPWGALLDFLADHPREERQPRALVVKVVAALAGKDEAAAQKMMNRARDLAQAGGHAWLPAVLRAAREPAPARPRRPPEPSRPPAARSVFTLAGGGKAEPEGTLHYVHNAGLVLAGPFLSHLFTALDVLGEGADGKPVLRDLASASRAVHLLQWLVDERTDRPETALLLNKILCGLEPSAPIEPAIEPAAAHIATCEQLLKAMLAHWTIISNTSFAGLRETFLQREGRLERREAGWSLQVERKTVDVLVDQVPWGFSMIFNPWQPVPLTTTW